MRTLLWIAAGIAVVGIALLLLVEPDVSAHSLELKGTITRVDERGKVTIISMIPEDFSVISFEDAGLDPGEHTLRGHLQEYDGKVEFVVDGHD